MCQSCCYLADWTVEVCTLSGSWVQYGWGPCDCEDLSLLELVLVGGKTSPWSLTDTSRHPCRCIGLR